MPKYVFTCDTCGKSQEKFASVKTITSICECGAESKRQLPNIAGHKVTETIDPYTNVRWDQNQKEEVKQRRDDYYWEYEVPKLVEKYSLETCLEQGWLVYNEKRELVINKPPSKR